MVQIHPILSGVPASFLFFLIVSEILPFTRFQPFATTVRWIAVIALASGCSLAFISGYQASYLAGDISEQANEVLSQHHTFGKLLFINSLLLLTALVLGRVATRGKVWVQRLYYFSALLEVFLLILTGRLGGALVFEHAVGVVAPCARECSSSPR
jgi:uncharacterized membrane protein